ncbi:MAG: acyltransferase [Ilumatobacteraceae bacterium]|nr:acyltransferase [Ilumatobacteraceae bacterium]
MDQRYFGQLNGLRAIAVLAVIATHTVDVYHRPWVVWGEEGVTLFFAISGFLITGILLDARGSAASTDTSTGTVLRAFYIRRFLRIFPIYYATIFVAALLNFDGVRAGFWWYLTYTSNWYIAFDEQWNVATHAWSLAVEEQFYLFWPLVILLVPRRALPWVIGAMVAVGPVTRGVLVTATDMWRPGIDIITPSTFDALGLGAALAWAWRSEHGASLFVRWCGIAGVALLAVNRIAAFNDADTIAGVTRMSIPLICIVVVHAACRGVPGPIGRFLESTPMTHIGVVSYGMYLLHPFIEQSARTAGDKVGVSVPEYGVVLFVAVTMVTVLASTASWRLFEAPINRRKVHHPYVPAAHRADGEPVTTRPTN